MVRRVMIFWVFPLFYETVYRLLEHPEIEIVGSGSDPAVVQMHIETTQPDTIIIEESEDKLWLGTEIVRILDSCPWSPRVVRLSLQDNELWAYRCERSTLASREDLVRLICNPI